MIRLCALAIVLAPSAALAENYLGILKPPQTSLQPSGLYSFATAPEKLTSLAPENGLRFKLGYKYSRYFAVEGEFTDFARPADVFANPASLTSAFRSAGFGVDTVATLPVWRFSFYGRMGAYRGDRLGFNPYTTSLLSDVNRGTRWRYGLGVRYDITKSLGVRAELERYSAAGLGQPFAGDGESDQFTVGLSWRF